MTDQPFSVSTAAQDDKVVAALGPFIAIILWATQRQIALETLKQKEPET